MTNHLKMKFAFLLSLVFSSFYATAQYYYKDIIGTRETFELIKNYKANKVTKVTLTSFDAANTRSDDFYVEQTFSPAAKTLRTLTRLGGSQGSVLTSYIDDSGNVVRTTDSSELSISNTVYQYDPSGKLLSILNSTSDTSNTFTQTEEHIWQYNSDKPARMIRVKDKRDTTFVELKLDNNGNVIEEQSVHKGEKSVPVLYFYDANNRMTDIVRFNGKARRLLPEYLFEYSSTNQVIQKITVPANSSEYLIWRYQYDNRGLKVKEAIFNKKKQLTGKIEYQYQFGS
jgi:hypothetical protein